MRCEIHSDHCTQTRYFIFGLRTVCVSVCVRRWVCGSTSNIYGIFGNSLKRCIFSRGLLDISMNNNAKLLVRSNIVCKICKI